MRPWRAILPGMTADLILALVVFAFASSITPGPNNIMLLASGANFGLRRTVPHMLGIALGHAVMVSLVGLGLMGLFEALPRLRAALMVACAAYLLFLAWKIAVVKACCAKVGTDFARLQHATSNRWSGSRECE